MNTIKEFFVNYNNVNKIGNEISLKVNDEDIVIKIVGDKFPIDSTSDTCRSKHNDQKKDLKPPLNTKQLVAKLKEHGILLREEEEANAYCVLNEINYYRLSVFIRYMSEDNMTFNRLMELYYFDRFLRNNIEQLINPIEEFLKTSLANHLTCKAAMEKTDDSSPSLIYLNRGIFNLKKHTIEEIDNMEHIFYTTVKKNLEREPSLKHHLENYNGNIPFWVLVEHLTFGNISSFISFLSRSWRKDWIEDKMKYTDGHYISGPKELPGWIDSLRIVRNVCAHMGRLYGRNFPFRVNFNNIEGLESILLNSNEFKQSLFCALFIIRRFYLLLSNERKTEWNIFIEELDTKVESFNIDTNQMGIDRLIAEDWLIQ